jgi:hypothetical protein
MVLQKSKTTKHHGLDVVELQEDLSRSWIAV